MTMTMDVNQDFADERAGQIAAAAERNAQFDQRVADGKLIALGNGRFRVNEPGSWDNGEVLVQRGGQVLPQHGLDLNEDGSAKLYTSVPAWHGLGTVIPGGTSDVERVLDLAGLNFDVEPRITRYAFGGEVREVPGSFVNVRTDTGDPLGVVGKIYTPVQNRDGFSFLQELVNSGEAIWESAGPLRGGRKVFISMRLPEDVIIDAEGIADTVTPFVAVINSHDGSSPFQSVTTPWRPVCRNTERFAVRDAYTRWTVRHTTNALNRIEEARRTLGLTLRYYERFAEEETRLAQTEILMDEFRTLCADLWPTPEEPTVRQANAAEKRSSALDELFAAESARCGRTAYAAERAVTGYMDHAAPKRVVGDALAAARATAIMEGTDDDIKTRAHAKLMLRVA